MAMTSYTTSTLAKCVVKLSTPCLKPIPCAQLVCLILCAGQYGWYAVWNSSSPTAYTAPKRLELILFNVPRQKWVYWTSCWPAGELSQCHFNTACVLAVPYSSIHTVQWPAGELSHCHCHSMTQPVCWQYYPHYTTQHNSRIAAECRPPAWWQPMHVHCLAPSLTGNCQPGCV